MDATQDRTTGGSPNSLATQGVFGAARLDDGRRIGNRNRRKKPTQRKLSTIVTALSALTTLSAGAAAEAGADVYKFQWTATVTAIADGPLPGIEVGDRMIATVSYDTLDFADGVNKIGDGLDYAAPAGLEMIYEFESGGGHVETVTAARARDGGSFDQWNWKGGVGGLLFQVNDFSDSSWDLPLPACFATMHGLLLDSLSNMDPADGNHVEIGGSTISLGDQAFSIAAADTFKFEWTATVAAIIDGPVPGVQVGDGMVATIIYDNRDFADGVDVIGDGLDYAAPVGLQMTYAFQSGGAHAETVTDVRARDGGSFDQWNWDGGPGGLFFQVNDFSDSSWDLPLPACFVTMHGLFLDSLSNMDPADGNHVEIGGSIILLDSQAFSIAPYCPWDLDHDGIVGTSDLICLLGSWDCPYATADLIELLGNWGPCP